MISDYIALNGTKTMKNSTDFYNPIIIHHRASLTLTRQVTSSKEESTISNSTLLKLALT